MLTRNLTWCMITLQKKSTANLQEHVPCTKPNQPTANPSPHREINMSQDFGETQKEQLISILTNELKMLRSKVDASQQDLASRLGLSRQAYAAIESKAQKMTWSNFLALLMIFTNNEATAKIIDWIEAYPPELKQYLGMTGSSTKSIGKNVKRVKSDSIKPMAGGLTNKGTRIVTSPPSTGATIGAQVP